MSDARLYVGNIPWTTTVEELREIFSVCQGVREVDIPTGRQGRSRGYGIVEFASNDDARVAVTRMDGEIIYVRCARDVVMRVCVRVRVRVCVWCELWFGVMS